MSPELITKISNFLSSNGRGAFVPAIVSKLKWPNRTDAQGEAFLKHGVILLKYVDSYGITAASPFAERFLDLIGFLGTLYFHLVTPDEHAKWLIRFNETFGMLIVHPKLIEKNIHPVEVVRYFAELDRTGVVSMPAFTNFVAAHGADAFLRLYGIYTKWKRAGRAIVDLYVFLNLLFVANVPMEFLTVATFSDTRRIMSLYPSTRRFSGFASWGRGDSEASAIGAISYASNIANHFRKHVLNAGAKALDDISECPHWWATLNIVVHVSQLHAVPGSSKKTSALALFNADDVLPPGNITPFLEFMHAELMKGDSKLLQWFEIQFKIKYKDVTLAFATSMTDVAVFIERGNLFVSGRKTIGEIDYYIVVRLDNDVMTISSCYVATNIMAKINGRAVLWQFPNP